MTKIKRLLKLYKGASVAEKGRRPHSLSCVSPVGDEGVDEELVPVSSCNVQWCVSILIFTVYLSTFRKTQTKHLVDETLRKSSAFTVQREK